MNDVSDSHKGQVNAINEKTKNTIFYENLVIAKLIAVDYQRRRKRIEKTK